LDLAGRSVINEIEVGEEENLDEYYTPGSKEHVEMVDRIRQRLRLTTLQYQKLDDLVDAIGLPKEKLCTHCWDNSSSF
jgi:amidophosphoribosyltransferase